MIKLLRKAGEDFVEIEYQHVLKKSRNKKIKTIIVVVIIFSLALLAYAGI